MSAPGVSAPGDFAAPLDLGDDHVRAEWIDYNGHMNVAYYVLAFDYATDRLYDRIGLGQAYMTAHRCSTFTLESHINYLQEVQLGDPLRFAGQLLDFDTKRTHWYFDMFHRDEGYHAAALEFLTIHVDMESRRSAPFPADVLARLGALKAAHSALPIPKLAGRTIGIRRATD